MIKKAKTRQEFFELSNFRRRFMVLILLALFATLFSRAFYLQSMQKDFLQSKGGDISNRNEKLHAFRGKILDRNNELLAASTPVETIWANPSDIILNITQKKKLAVLLKMRKDHLEDRLSKKNTNHVYLRRQISPELAGKIMAMKIPGIYSEKNYRRYYPGKEAMAHVVGFTNVDGDGIEGIELQSNEFLSGEHGFRKVLKNRKGNVVDDLQEIQIPVDGKDVILSLDKRLQYASYKALEKAVEKHAALSGSAVLINARTGEVLAMSNYPSFNPNTSRSAQRSKYIKNRVVTDIFEPGSTLKPLTVSAALKNNSVTPSTLIDTAKGFYRVGKRLTVRDTHANGIISVKEVVQKSSNIGTTHIVEGLEKKYLWSMLNSFGMGTKTGIQYPGEVTGKIHHYEDWGETERATISYGYGISSTLIQLAQAYTVFANDGVIKPISLFKEEGLVIGRRVIDKKTSHEMLQILESVVTEGTAPYAKVKGYRVAGKTGTTKKLDMNEGGYGKKYIGSFVGMAPASNPRFILAVMIDEPTVDGYYGGVVAAPVFSSIMTEALKIYSIPQDEIEFKNPKEQKMVYLNQHDE